MPARDDVSEFLKNVRELDQQTMREDEQRANRLQQDIADGRRQRQALRENKLGSPNPNRSPSPPRLPARRDDRDGHRESDRDRNRDRSANANARSRSRWEGDVAGPPRDEPRKALLDKFFKDKSSRDKASHSHRSMSPESATGSHNRHRSGADRVDRAATEPIREPVKPTRPSNPRRTTSGGARLPSDDESEEDPEERFRQLAAREQELRAERILEKKLHRESARDTPAPPLPSRPVNSSAQAHGHAHDRDESPKLTSSPSPPSSAAREERLAALRQLRERRSTANLDRARSSALPAKPSLAAPPSLQQSKSVNIRPSSLGLTPDLPSPVSVSKPSYYQSPEPDFDELDASPRENSFERRSASPSSPPRRPTGFIQSSLEKLSPDRDQIRLMNPVARSSVAPKSSESARSRSSSPNRPTWLSSALSKQSSAAPSPPPPRSQASVPLRTRTSTADLDRASTDSPKQAANPSTPSQSDTPTDFLADARTRLRSPSPQRKSPERPPQNGAAEPKIEKLPTSLRPVAASPKPQVTVAQVEKTTNDLKPSSPSKREEHAKAFVEKTRDDLRPASPTKRKDDNDPYVEKTSDSLRKAAPIEHNPANDPRVEKTRGELRPAKPRNITPAKPAEAIARLQQLRTAAPKPVRVPTVPEALQKRQALRSPDRKEKEKDNVPDFSSQLSSALSKGPTAHTSQSQKGDNGITPAPAKIKRAQTFDSAQLDSQDHKLEHLTKTRARGPKRKLPKANSFDSAASSKIPTSSPVSKTPRAGASISDLKAKFEQTSLVNKPRPVRSGATPSEADRETVLANAKRVVSNKQRPPPRQAAKVRE